MDSSKTENWKSNGKNYLKHVYQSIRPISVQKTSDTTQLQEICHPGWTRCICVTEFSALLPAFHNIHTKQKRTESMVLFQKACSSPYVPLLKCLLAAITRLAVYRHCIILDMTSCVFEKRPSHYRNATVQPYRYPIHCVTKHDIITFIQLFHRSNN